MIHVHKLEKRFEPRVVFSDLDWHIKKGQRIGLVGPNGAGKSTLFKIIVGEMTADAGQVSISKTVKIGYLPQEVATIVGSTVREQARKGLAHVLAVGEQMRELEEQLSQAEADDAEQLMSTYGVLQAQFEEMGGFTVENRVEEVLMGLGFRTTDFERDCAELSGGWQVRVHLARLLLQEPDVLFLDEPTNHLDLTSLVWLEGFLQAFPGAVVFISHDRWFLNRLSSHIAELSRRGLRSYKGTFEQYLLQAEQERDLLERRQKNQQRRIADLERFVERFRAKATKARQVQSRVKALEKMERIELESEDRKVHFRLPEVPKSGRVTITLSNARKAYGIHEVYSRLDVELIRGQRVALVGPNGAGKSTLMKVLAGAITLDEGERALGFRVRPYYFAQHQVDTLDFRRTVLTEASIDSDTDNVTQIRGVLGAFLFGDDDIDKRVEVLSGGERARLALVKMLLAPGNLLLLDEPTNHLDMGSRNMLENALADFEGTIVVISHDRHFIDAICNEVWEVADGRITPFTCSYAEYLKRNARGERPEPLPLHTPQKTDTKGPKPASRQATKPVSKEQAPEKKNPVIEWGAPRDQSVRRRKSKEQKRQEAEARRGRAAEQRQAKSRYANAEKEINRLESLLESLRNEQADPAHYRDGDRVREVAVSVSEAEKALQTVYGEWEALVALLET